MRGSRFFYLACFGFTTGVAWRSFWHFNFYWLAVFVAFSILILTFSLLKRSLRLGVVVLLALVLGVWRFAGVDMPLPKVFEAQIGQTTEFAGQIISDPETSQTGAKLKLAVKQTGSQTIVLVFVKQRDEYQYGDQMKVVGLLERPTNFMTDQGLEFDYVNYLRKDGVNYVMRNPKIKVLASGRGNPVLSFLYAAKKRFDQILNLNLPVPENLLMEGLILGERSAFTPELRQVFMDTGTVHLVTIGGYHVSLVAGWIMAILGFLPVALATGAGVVSIFLYILVTGGAQTTIRAGIMATMALVAKATGRVYVASRALVLAAILMIFINPFVLVYDVSFELSFIATIAIIFLSPRVEKYFTWIPWKAPRDIVSITCSMYMFALPFVLYRIGNLSLVSLPANLIVVPVMPLAMILGFLTGIVGFIFPHLAFIPGKLAFLSLSFVYEAITRLAHVPHAALAISNFPLLLVIVIYLIFIWIFFFDSSWRMLLKFKSLILVTPLLITLMTSAWLYVGHQNANFEAKQRQQVLLGPMDAGKPSNYIFVPLTRFKSSRCLVKGALPDPLCTPGAIFSEATTVEICVPGYTKTVRSVSENTRKQVFSEYGITYPPAKSLYEVDHFIPLALGGSNDIANLWPEISLPVPGFHEKDVVEVYLQQQVCRHGVALGRAQEQIATNWLAVYNNISFEEKLSIQKKYSGTQNPN